MKKDAFIPPRKFKSFGTKINAQFIILNRRLDEEEFLNDNKDFMNKLDDEAFTYFNFEHLNSNILSKARLRKFVVVNDIVMWFN
jgi:hypothetical protein